MAPVKIGIIGGTGLEDPDIFQNRQEVAVTTPFGPPSDVLVKGTISGVSCVLLSRHGKKHTIAPTEINFRANIYALKQEGCTHIISGTACGSLQENIAPGDLVFIDQFIDRTNSRKQSFYDGSRCTGVAHCMAAEPFCARMRGIFAKCAQEAGLKHHKKGTMVTIEGPRFSSKAESLMFRQWGGHVINMTSCPEAILANEAGIPYAACAMATDYDCWRESEEAVSVEMVLKTLKENAERAKTLFLRAVPAIAKEDWGSYLEQCSNNAKFMILPGGQSVFDAPKEPVRHIVMFGFKESATASQIQACKDGLLGMSSKIPVIKGLEIGEDLQLPSGQKHPAGKNRSLALIVDFDSKEDYEEYAAHKDHQQVIRELIAPIMADGSRAAIQFANGKRSRH
jgi:5'-methylthioadenosine phosphorylase